MIALCVALGDKSKDGALHAEVQKTQVSHNRNCQYPDSEGDISETMQDERRKEEPDRHVGYCSKPVEQYVSGNMSYTQLQARSPWGWLSFEKRRHISLVLDDPKVNANSLAAMQDLTMPVLAGMEAIL